MADFFICAVKKELKTSYNRQILTKSSEVAAVQSWPKRMARRLAASYCNALQLLLFIAFTNLLLIIVWLLHTWSFRCCESEFSILWIFSGIKCGTCTAVWIWKM